MVNGIWEWYTAIPDRTGPPSAREAGWLEVTWLRSPQTRTNDIPSVCYRELMLPELTATGEIAS